MAISRGLHAAKQADEIEHADACAEAGIEVQRSLRAVDQGHVVGQRRRSCVEADMPADWCSPIVRERREANDRY